MEPYCGREGTISRQFPSGDIRVRFGEPGAIWAGIEWTYNPLAVRLAGDVPFAPLTLRDAAVGQRVRVSREQVCGWMWLGGKRVDGWENHVP